MANMILILLAAFSLAASSQDGGTIVECASKDVWDDGYVLRFDLDSLKRDPYVEIQSEIFEIVPLWHLEQVFAGSLVLVEPESADGCLFRLVDRFEEPSVEIEFRICQEPSRVEVLQVMGQPPKEFGELVCHEKLVESLSSRR